MSLLLITLPPHAAGPSLAYPWARSADGQGVAAHGASAAALLPPGGRGVEVVAVVPAASLSWHRVALPKGVGPGSPRLRAILAGVLEDRVLNDVDELHFALAPGSAGGAETWVAVCDRAWLAGHLQALDAAQRPVARIVPELAPQDGAPRVWITGEADAPLLALRSGAGVPGGVQVLPLAAATLPLLGLADPDAEGAPAVLAEPSAAAVSEQLLRHPVALQGAPDRALDATRAGWDLAQLDFSRTGRARTAKRAAAAWRDVLHAPAWRPARWGAALLVLANLVGLNVWAWQTRADLAARRQAVTDTLQQTFPNVKVVVDAPLQMQREVTALRQSSGAASARDLEPMLSAFGQVVGAQSQPVAIEYGAGELRLRGQALAASELSSMSERLRPAGYSLSADANGAVLRAEGGR